MTEQETVSKSSNTPLRTLSLSVAEILQTVAARQPWTAEYAQAIVKQQQSDRLSVPASWKGKQILCMVLNEQQANEIKRIDASRNHE